MGWWEYVYVCVQPDSFISLSAFVLMASCLYVRVSVSSRLSHVPV